MMMASCSSTTTPRPSSFTFFPTPTPTPPLPPQKLLFKPLLLKQKQYFTTTSIKSIDVSKEDKQDQPISPSSELELDDELLQTDQTIDKRRLEEKFAVVNTGIYECRSCGYTYDQASGDPSYPVPPGLPFDRLPEDWRCPTCGASQSFFQSKSMEIAGFAQNQQFGLGGNTLTSGQKALLIYGSLLLGFGLFLSGYFLT